MSSSNQQHGVSQHQIDNSAAILSEYEILKVPECQAVLESVLGRTIPEASTAFRVKIVSTEDPIALSPGANTIIISRGLLKLLSTEAQLGFILTHEAGHYLLNHLGSSNLASLSNNERRDLEKAADKFAVERMITASYEASESLAALQSVQRSISGNPSLEYPSLVERIQNLSSLVLQSRRYGGGIVDRRDYRRCFAQLP